MQAIVGQTRSRKLIKRLADLGIWEICQPDEYPPRRYPWVADNGAYKRWKKDLPCDTEGLVSMLDHALSVGNLPEWVVIPDIVAGGAESLAYSLAWLQYWRSELRGLRWYLAVQDGMEPKDLRFLRGEIDGLFVGGTLAWKLATGAQWCAYGHSRGWPVHIGRVGSARRIAWAIACGADSVDSCLPLFAERNLAPFLAALNQQGLGIQEPPIPRVTKTLQAMRPVTLGRGRAVKLTSLNQINLL